MRCGAVRCGAVRCGAVEGGRGCELFACVQHAAVDAKPHLPALLTNRHTPTPSPTCTACILPWRSLSYVSKCLAKARTDIEDLRRRKAHLEAATQWRPCLRR